MNTDQIAAETAEAWEQAGRPALAPFIKSACEKAKDKFRPTIRRIHDIATRQGWEGGETQSALDYLESRAAHASEHLLDQIEGARNCIRKHFYNQAELILNDVLSQRTTPATASEIVPAGEVEGDCGNDTKRLTEAKHIIAMFMNQFDNGDDEIPCFKFGRKFLADAAMLLKRRERLTGEQTKEKE